ncbi:hypothetical protein P7K49_024303 [Saguinus oedipus]|uniref:Uncharacterized protein n=1 Tax=Saguinus oedipus TaxID=9490 RepID=A0ABQ9UP44_SAGOE|nr:hypothetical protein P7K49_024303 [Saguinus oedipus]
MPASLGKDSLSPLRTPSPPQGQGLPELAGAAVHCHQGPVSETFRDVDTKNVLGRRTSRSPTRPSCSAPAPGGAVLRCLGEGLSRLQAENGTPSGLGPGKRAPDWGWGPRPVVGLGAPATDLRSDHMPHACLRLGLHLPAARKQEPLGASHPARPHQRSRGCPFPPPNTRPQSVLPAEGTRAPAGAVPRSARVANWARPFRVHVYSRVPSAGVGLCTRLLQKRKVRSGAGMCGRQEFPHLRRPPLTQRQLRLGYSSGAASAPTRSPPRCDNADSLARSELRAPGSRLRVPGSRLPAPGSGRPPGRTWWSRAGRGRAAQAAPPTRGGEWSAPHPTNSQPSAQPN